MSTRAHAAPAATRSGWRTVVSDYVEMTKPKVQSLLLFTTITTMYVAGDPSLGLVALTGRAWRAVPWRWPVLVAALALCALVPLLLAFVLLLLAVEWWEARAAT